MKTTISVVTTIPFDEPVIRNRLFPLFEELKIKGFEVRCICLKSKFNKDLFPENILIEETENHWKKSKNFISRFFKEAIIASKLLKKAKKANDDIVLITIPSMFLSFLTPFYFRNKQILLDIRDLTWEYLSDTSFLHKHAKIFFRFLFKRSLPYYKLISVTNESELKFVSLIAPHKEVVHTSNGVRQEQFNRLNKVYPSPNENLTVIYTGNIGLAQDLSTLIKAARQLPKIHFIVIGDGVDFERVQTLVSQYSLKNVELTGRVNWEHILGFYNSAHILYAQLTPDFSGAMPSKLYEYLATGKHVLYGGEGQAVETLSQFEANDVVTPCDPKVLVKKLLELEEKLNRSYLSQENKRIIKENYIRETAISKLVAKIEKKYTKLSR